jgi:hypothetical protein
MTMVAPQGNDATSTAEAAAVGRWRHQQQWWQQKQWDNIDGNDRQQRQQCGPCIALLTTMATGTMPTITAMVATARMTKIMMTSLDRGWQLQRQQLKRDGDGGGSRSDDGGGRQQSTRVRQ